MAHRNIYYMLCQENTKQNSSEICTGTVL